MTSILILCMEKFRFYLAWNNSSTVERKLVVWIKPLSGLAQCWEELVWLLLGEVVMMWVLGWVKHDVPELAFAGQEQLPVCPCQLCWSALPVCIEIKPKSLVIWCYSRNRYVWHEGNTSWECIVELLLVLWIGRQSLAVAFLQICHHGLCPVWKRRRGKVETPQGWGGAALPSLLVHTWFDFVLLSCSTVAWWWWKYQCSVFREFCVHFSVFREFQGRCRYTCALLVPLAFFPLLKGYLL